MSAKFEIEKFDGKGDLSLWRKKLKALLVQQKVSKVIEKKIPDTVSDEKKQEMEETVFSTMILYLSDTVLQQVNDIETTVELWEKLESLYLSKSLSSKILLKERFFSFRMNPAKNLEENLDEFTKICLDLANTVRK